MSAYDKTFCLDTEADNVKLEVCYNEEWDGNCIGLSLLSTFNDRTDTGEHFSLNKEQTEKLIKVLQELKQYFV